MIKNRSMRFFLDYLVWFVFILAGFLGFIYSLYFIPRTQAINNPFDFYFKIILYILICLGISFFPNRFRYGYILIILPFIILIGLIIPRITYIARSFTLTEPGMANEFKFDDLYTMVFYILYPFINLIAAFSFRLAGGSTGKTFKVSFCGQLVFLSGFLDLMWHIINGVQFGERLQGAFHIKVVIGQFPTLAETIIFALCHIPLLAGLFMLPIDKWLAPLFPAEVKQENNRD